MKDVKDSKFEQDVERMINDIKTMHYNSNFIFSSVQTAEQVFGFTYNIMSDSFWYSL